MEGLKANIRKLAAAQGKPISGKPNPFFKKKSKKVGVKK